MIGLDVLLGTDLAGRLHYDPTSTRFAFRYYDAWLSRHGAYPLGPTLPLTPSKDETPDNHSRDVRVFFENLLPEGQSLDDAAAASKLSKSNTIGLLKALGGEMAGAIRLQDPGASPSPSTRRLISPEELSDRVRTRKEIPFSVWDSKVRLSIAGYQDKLAVLEDNGQWYLAEGPELASTHIVKPEPLSPILAGLTSNEFFCMRLARAVGLPVADVRFVQAPDPLLVITRFDRSLKADRVERKHVIDGCQALGFPVAHKYERLYGDGRDVKDIREGPSLPRLFAFARSAAVPAAAQIGLLRWVVFQVLIGNMDAHAKNLSFFFNSAGAELAPAYDLVSGLVFSESHIEQSYAMAVGDAFTPGDLTAFEWAELCIQSGIHPRLLTQEIRQLAKKTHNAIAVIAPQVTSEGADSGVTMRIAQTVELECDRQIEMAKGIVEAYQHQEKR